MQARVEDGGVLLERVLGAVAVVDVPVEDQDLLEPVSALKVAGEDRDVVEQAEAEGEGALRVVAGRTGEAEPVMEVARHEAVGEGEPCPGRDPRGVEGVPAHPDVGNVEERSAGSAHFLRSGDVLGSVHRFQPLGRAGARPRPAPAPPNQGSRPSRSMVAARRALRSGWPRPGSCRRQAGSYTKPVRRRTAPGAPGAPSGASSPRAGSALTLGSRRAPGGGPVRHPSSRRPLPGAPPLRSGVAAAPTTRHPAACRGRRAPAGWG